MSRHATQDSHPHRRTRGRHLYRGADDYVAKPFSVAQLVLRVQAVLRRSRIAMEMDNHIRLGENIELDWRNLSGRRGRKTLSFTRREMEVMQYLSSHSWRPVSREELLTKVWGYARGLALETRTVDIHIAKLRRKIEPDPGQPRHPGSDRLFPGGRPGGLQHCCHHRAPGLRAMGSPARSAR
jgi:DNA-binding response OmpR family regulator